jgi:hypothetical protein
MNFMTLFSKKRTFLPNTKLAYYKKTLKQVQGLFFEFLGNRLLIILYFRALKKLKKNVFILVALSLLLFFSCKKDHGLLGVDAQPEDDQLNAVYSDTARVFAHTLKYDSTPSFNDKNKYLGSTQDPVFGRTDANLYTNLNLKNSETNITFGLDPNLTGAEIILTIADLEAAGTFSSVLNYSVLALNSTLDKNLIYYTNAKGMYNPSSVLAVHTGSIEEYKGRLVLRIPIDLNYANSILLNTQYLADNATLQSNYKGFYITSSGSNLNPSDQPGFMAKYNLEDEVSGFYLYYQNGTPSPSKEYKSYQFTFAGNDAVRFNSVTYDAGSIPEQCLVDQVVNKDTTKGSQHLYLKGLGGTKVKFFIPSIKNFADTSSISVNRAEVIFYVDPAYSANAGTFTHPPKFALLPINDFNQELLAQDQLSETDLVRYGGNYDEGSGRVVFNIPREIQAVMRGRKKNRGYYLVVADPSPLYTARRDNYHQRIVLAGTSHPTLKPKFNLSYVKLAHD